MNLSGILLRQEPYKSQHNYIEIMIIKHVLLPQWMLAFISKGWQKIF